jgi:O-antigen ligase
VTTELDRHRSNRFTAGLFLAVIAAAPLPFGSAAPPAIAFWCVVLGGGLALVRPPPFPTLHLAILAGIALLIAGYLFVLHEQLVEHPWIAPLHPIWSEVGDVIGQKLAPSAAIAHGQPAFAIGGPLAAILALVTGIVVGRDRVRAHQALRVMAWSGAGYAIYGIAAFVIDPGKILWRQKQAYVTDLTAIFVNRNTAAAYFGSCALVWLLLLGSAIRHHLPRGPLEWSTFSGRILSNTPRDVVMAFAMLFVCLAAMFMTGSRGGVVLSLLMLVVAFALLFRRDFSYLSTWMAAIAAALVIAFVLLQIMGAGVNARFNIEDLASESRFETYRSTLRMIADHPWFGTGLGTFVLSYPAYRSDRISVLGVWDRAHSTPLELAAEAGLPLAGAIAVGWLIVFVVLIRGVIIRRRDAIIPLAGLVVGLLGNLHSMIDFSLQIPGYAIVVFAIVGVGLAQSVRSGQPKTERTTKMHDSEPTNTG